ncbi:hypothetical protein ALI144C_31060 [Actinosynnema sp. ALI-1.44]|nr:hypothetical protein ALI144C_31060 [Actinosynnema sp. ALI-1.44]
MTGWSRATTTPQYENPRRLAARVAHRQHLTELHAAGRLVMAEPWQDDSGALLVFRGDQAEVEAIMAADPHYRAPGVCVDSLRQWRPIVGSAPPPRPA